MAPSLPVMSLTLRSVVQLAATKPQHDGVAILQVAGFPEHEADIHPAPNIERFSRLSTGLIRLFLVTYNHEREG